MTNKQIFEKAIEKAGLTDSELHWDLKDIEGRRMSEFTLRGFLLSHDFAKALWGQNLREDTNFKWREWQYHLKQMVLEEDPIKYLEKYV